MIVSIIAFAVSLIFLNYTIKNKIPSPKYSYADFPKKFKARHFTKYGYSKQRAKEIIKLYYIEIEDIYYNFYLPKNFKVRNFTKYVNSKKNTKEILKLDYIDKADIYYNEILIRQGFIPEERTLIIKRLK